VTVPRLVENVLVAREKAKREKEREREREKDQNIVSHIVDSLHGNKMSMRIYMYTCIHTHTRMLHLYMHITHIHTYTYTCGGQGGEGGAFVRGAGVRMYVCACVPVCVCARACVRACLHFSCVCVSNSPSQAVVRGDFKYCSKNYL